MRGPTWNFECVRIFSLAQSGSWFYADFQVFKPVPKAICQTDSHAANRGLSEGTREWTLFVPTAQKIRANLRLEPACSL
jgi:hypothetical protein